MARGIDGHKGKLFKDFSRSESIAWNVTIEMVNEAGEIIDLSAYQLFVSYTVNNVDCSVATIEQQLSLVGGETNKFYGVISDEDTITLPDNSSTDTVYGALKLVDPAGVTTFLDKAEVTVYPCRNPRLDQV